MSPTNQADPTALDSMTAVDELWFLSDVAAQQAEQTYHRLAEDHDRYLEFTRTRRVSRPRFRTVAERTRENGLPYGAHSIVYRGSGELLLVRHDAVDMWVLPGGEVDGGESFRAAARRELGEEAGVDAEFDGLAMLARVEFHCDGNTTWGVLPIFTGRATTTDIVVDDPEDEITDAGWFEELPEDTRDRNQLRRWREHWLGD
jgi:8-oxo-dGTP diphosphatase